MSKSDIAVRVRGVSKSYTIARNQEKERDLTVALLKRLKHPFYRPQTETFWALKEIDFDIKKGDVVGIIGRNGAGKSTLLKILSRITEPTTGRIDLYGRVGSLLEVGTGFHPELTGRENVYLNGAILGMTKAEINRQFDAIVDFSGVEQFLDTPVKRYSSGMYVRLAFAVAAHLNPEILIVDEVLSVGDAQFQKRCIGKMGDVARQGRTVLVVSHQLAVIQALCSTAVCLERGTIHSLGSCKEVVAKYLLASSSDNSIRLDDRVDRVGNGSIRFIAYELRGPSGSSTDSLWTGKSGNICIYFRNHTGKSLQNLHISIGIDDVQGQRIGYLSNENTGDYFETLPADLSMISISLSRLPLVAGRYRFTLFGKLNGVIADWVQNAGQVDVQASDYYGTGKLPDPGQGHILLDHRFTFSAIEHQC